MALGSSEIGRASCGVLFRSRGEPADDRPGARCARGHGDPGVRDGGRGPDRDAAQSWLWVLRRSEERRVGCSSDLVANLLMTVRERGVRVATAILAFVTVVAVLTGTLLNHGFGFFGDRKSVVWGALPISWRTC